MSPLSQMSSSVPFVDRLISIYWADCITYYEGNKGDFSKWPWIFLFRAEETLDETVVMLQRYKVTGVGSPSVSFHVDTLMDSIYRLIGPKDRFVSIQ